MRTLSVVISAFNEEKKLGACLDSVQDFADEIIVVDNESTDKTTEIAKKHHAKVIKRANNLMLNVNKNVGFSKATGEWILNLDADERVSEELKQEIMQVLSSSDSQVLGYEMPRKNIIFGKWIEHTGWYPDYHLRLFRKGKGKFEEEHVHEKIAVEGEVEKLSGHILHKHYDSIFQFLQKTMLIYAPNEADQLVKKGYVFSYRDAVRFPAREFFGRYFLRQGFKDGFHGFMLSLLMACYHLIVFSYLWEKERFQDDSTATAQVESQLKESGRDFRYWRTDLKVKSAGNFVSKTFYQVLRKLSHV